MLLTEEEAKKRWCPFARVTIGGKLPTSMNRLQTIGKDSDGDTVTEGALRLPIGARCIASECMAWRHHGPGWRTSETAGNYAVELGFCGLASVPQS